MQATIDDVAARGRQAVIEAGRRFDCPSLTELFVTSEELEGAQVSESDLAAIHHAIDRVRHFHEIELQVITNDWEKLPDGWGWRTDATDADETGFEGQRMLAAASAGVYVPGGQAAYPSSVIMNVVPAQVAGVERIVVASPCRPDGTLPASVLVACRELGVTEILKAGGASAIAFLALGDESLDRVDVVAGPGNAYVAEAKRQLWGAVGLDLYAGPSEVAIVADGTTRLDWSVADFLAQLEHSADNVGVFVAVEPLAAGDVVAEIERQVVGQPRAEALTAALESQSVIVAVPDHAAASEAINDFAPEHLSVHLAEAPGFAMKIRNAGCILLGGETPQSAGDYANGPSHTLPTGGAARFSGPLSVQTFLRVQSLSWLTASDLAELTGTIEALATLEGFPAHARAAAIRRD